MPTGSLNITLDNFIASNVLADRTDTIITDSSGNLIYQGQTVLQNLANVIIGGSLDKTLSLNFTVSGSVIITGELSENLSSITGTSSGTNENHISTRYTLLDEIDTVNLVDIQSNYLILYQSTTISNFTTTFNGIVRDNIISVFANNTIDNFTLSSTETTSTFGYSNNNIINDYTLYFTEYTVTYTNLNQTIPDISLSSSGTVDLSGALDKSISITQQANGTINISGVSNTTISNYATDSSVSVIVDGNLNYQLEEATISGNTSVIVSPALDITIENITTTEVGTVSISGSMDQSIGNFDLYFAVRFLMYLEETISDFTIASQGNIFIDVEANNIVLDTFTSNTSVSVDISSTLSYNINNFSSDTLTDVIISANTIYNISAFNISGTEITTTFGNLNQNLEFITDSASTVSVTGVANTSIGNFGTITQAFTYIIGNIIHNIGDVSENFHGEVLNLANLDKSIEIPEFVSTCNVLVSSTLEENISIINENSTGVILISGNTTKTISNITTNTVGKILITGIANKNIGIIQDNLSGGVLAKGRSLNVIDNIEFTTTGNVLVSGNISKNMSNINIIDNNVKVLILGQVNTSLNNFTARAKAKGYIFAPDSMLIGV